MYAAGKNTAVGTTVSSSIGVIVVERVERGFVR